MRALVPNLHEDLVDLWDAAIPKLLGSLTGMSTLSIQLSLSLPFSLPFSLLPPCLLFSFLSSLSPPPPSSSLPLRPEQKEDMEPKLVGGPHAKSKAWFRSKAVYKTEFPSFSLFSPLSPPSLPPSLQLLSLSLDQVDNEEWLMELGNALGDQEQVVTKYSNFPQEKVGQL